MSGRVLVSLCMDTEGPCDDPASPSILSTWSRVDAAMDRLFDDSFRRRHLDPAGGHLRIGWFFLTWTGFRTNPRNRDVGYHRVRDHYLERWGDRLRALGDEECWHYHHPPASGVGNEWGLDWSASDEYAAILSRQVLERAWFPACFRAGGTILDPVSSRWVDQWFPFDFSNRAPVGVPGLVDWSPGVAEWSLYHPSPEDFRVAGAGRRRMARCLDLSSRIHSIDDAEITAAFERAAAGEPALLSCFDHDYRDIADRVAEFQARLADVARRHPAVPWRYAAPVEASRAWLGAAEPPPLRLEVGRFEGEVRIWAEEPLFQSIPWLAVRGREGGVRHVEEGVVRVDECRWVWRPPDELDWEEVAVAGSTWLGRSATARVERRGPGSRLSPLAAGRHPTRPRSIWEHSTLFRELCVERADGAAAEMDSVKQAVALLDGKVAPGDSVLDAGCAAGHAWRSLSRLGLEYHGIDGQRAAIEIGRGALGREGLPPERLRNLELEALPPGESYDVVLCLSTLGYMPDFRGPLEVLARAARRLLLVRSGFGEETRIRYLPDVLLDPPYQTMRAYFNVWARRDVEDFLEVEGFRLTWIDDVRQAERLGGRAEVVGGIELPNSWLVAERVRPAPGEEELLGDEFAEVARRWREERSGFERS